MGSCLIMRSHKITCHTPVKMNRMKYTTDLYFETLVRAKKSELFVALHTCQKINIQRIYNNYLK